MTYTILTHDAWGSVPVGSFPTLEEARTAFRDLCQDPWYRRDGGVKALELCDATIPGNPQRLDWFAVR